MGFLMIPLAVGLYAATKQESEGNECEASRSDLIRGKYENKIRFFASPEKVFEVFATEQDEGKPMMSYADFLHCITPYNFGELVGQEDIAEYLKENTPRILKMVDADGNGQICFTEFIFFLTFYQAPDGRIRKMFKRQGQKEMEPISKVEFVEGIRKIRHRSAQARKSHAKTAVDARKVKVSEEDLNEQSKAIADRFFGNSETITFDKLMKIKQDFHEDMQRYEFFTFKPDDQGLISMEDFLTSILTCMSGSKIDRYLRRIATVKSRQKFDSKVNFEQYRGFQVLLTHIDELKAKISQFRFVDFDMFWEFAIQFNKNHKTQITREQCLAVFAMLDIDESGELEEEEVMDVLGVRQFLGQNREEQAKNEAKLWVGKQVKKVRLWFQDLTGF